MPRKSQQSQLPEISLERMKHEPGIATRTAIARGPVRIVDEQGREVGILAVPRGERPEFRRK